MSRWASTAPKLPGGEAAWRSGGSDIIASEDGEVAPKMMTVHPEAAIYDKHEISRLSGLLPPLVADLVPHDEGHAKSYTEESIYQAQIAFIMLLANVQVPLIRESLPQNPKTPKPLKYIPILN